MVDVVLLLVCVVCDDDHVGVVVMSMWWCVLCVTHVADAVHEVDECELCDVGWYDDVYDMVVL